MKKKSGSRIIRGLKRVFQIRKWSDWERVNSYTRYIVNGLKRLFVPQSADKAQSFEAIKTKLNLSDDELLARKKGLYRLSVLMLSLALFVFSYAIYQLFMFNIAAFFLSFVVCLLALTFAFRYHFWYFQIKEQKLGCSIHEWFRQGVMGEKHE